MMLDCYLLALATGSSLDQTTNNFSLFSLVEELQVSPEILGQAISLEVHAYFFVAENARSQPFDLRVIRIRDGNQQEVGAPIPFRTADSDRFRLRIGGLRLPREYGTYRLKLEWRADGAEDWNDTRVQWPLIVRGRPAPADPALNAP